MLQATIAAVRRNDTIVEVCRENHWDSVHVFAPRWRHQDDVSDGTDLLLLVKLISDFYLLSGLLHESLSVHREGS